MTIRRTRHGLNVLKVRAKVRSLGAVDRRTAVAIKLAEGKRLMYNGPEAAWRDNQKARWRAGLTLLALAKEK